MCLFLSGFFEPLPENDSIKIFLFIFFDLFFFEVLWPNNRASFALVCTYSNCKNVGCSHLGRSFSFWGAEKVQKVAFSVVHQTVVFFCVLWANALGSLRMSAR